MKILSRRFFIKSLSGLATCPFLNVNKHLTGVTCAKSPVILFVKGRNLKSILNYALTSINQNYELLKPDQNVLINPGYNLREFYSSHITSNVLNHLVTLLRRHTCGNINIGDKNLQVSGSVYYPADISNIFIDFQTGNLPLKINLYSFGAIINEKPANPNHYPEINIVFRKLRS